MSNDYKLDNKHIADNMKKRYKQLGLSQQQFANELGVTKQHLNRVLSGNANLGYTNLIKTANILSCTVDYLLGYNVDVYVDISLNKEYEELTENLTEKEKIMLFRSMNFLKDELLKLREENNS